ncbi:carbonic anhydrase-related protein 10-like [Octopus sinensis]|uniref:Carbonic anhydrase-related protein 10-like n=1 Tax=Octopus sinensis TaxID=2607531 RepID=A0A6P7SLN3_9MOLL|nr:carbonic anhydrase-related protein 10-like [Octopus sinensis]
MWTGWWTYEGISGPRYWGLLNPEWKMCSEGKQQSPIDIQPKYMLFDPNLKHIVINKIKLSGTLRNVGHGIVMDINTTNADVVNISEGPLSYVYRAYEIKLRYANNDSKGSEHTINGNHFVGEIQIMAYNVDLYPTPKNASQRVKGMAILTAFLELSDQRNKALTPIIESMKNVHEHRGHKATIHHLSLDELIPKTDLFITYEGSLTEPGCHETVTWIIFNRPIYVSRDQLMTLRTIYTKNKHRPLHSIQTNSRPIMAINHRVIRTNINFPKPTNLCTMDKKTKFRVNPLYEDRV